MSYPLTCRTVARSVTGMSTHIPDHAAANGTVVTQRHADYCAAHGHATWVEDGVDKGLCPRCSAVKDGALAIGTRVIDANVARIYGAELATVGTVTRVYDSPVGMVEVQWGTEDDTDGPTWPEDVWADELTVVTR